MANKIALNIAGFNLIINTQEDEAQVRKLNDTLNNDLKQILSQNPSASVTNAALLCALDYLDRFDKATHSANNMRDQIRDYMSDASNAKLQYDEAVRQNTELSAEVESLRARITKMASEGAAGSAVEQSLKAEIDSVKSELANVRAQLKEQTDKNASILSDFGILNNALKSKDNEIANLNERINAANSNRAEADRKIAELSENIASAIAERDRFAHALIESNKRAEELASRVAAVAETSSAQPVSEIQPESEVHEEPSEIQAPFSEEEDVFFDDITEDLEEDEFTSDEVYDEDPDGNDLLVIDDAETQENETDSPVFVQPEKPAPKKDYRFFDYEDGAVEEQDGEVGVGDGFKTFGQMIAEERRQPGNSYEDANSGKLDDDSLPNLSWINDID